MKKLIYAVDKNSFCGADHSGVVLKVNAQIKQMEKIGINVELQQYDWADGLPQICVEDDTDFLYFRRVEFSVNLIRKLYDIKQKSKNIKIMMEIPTYPFKGEQKDRVSLKRKISVCIGTTLLRFVVDRIVLCGQKDKIKKLYGVQVIHFMNGVEYKNLPVNSYREANGEINMICVSACMLQHGYDRMIKGLEEYYDNTKNSRTVNFHVVGTGEYLEQYKKIAQKTGLMNKYVFFYGKQTGKELDEIYSKCNLAVNHLATHRVGIYYISSLKSREYAARGIPMVMSAPVGFEKKSVEKYMLYVPADESPINIEDVITFFDSLYPNPNIHNEIRDEFYELCDWEYTFIPIGEYLKSENR